MPTTTTTTTTTTLSLLLLVVILQTHVRISNGFSDLSLNQLKRGELDAMATRVCDGKVGNCPDMADFQVDSEVNRRLLSVQRKYISYETLKRNVVPCSSPGSSYYNCGASPANHYSRGCSVITHCARF